MGPCWRCHGIHRTSLTPYAASMRDADSDGARKFAERVWREQGVILLGPEVLENRGWTDRAQIEFVVEKHFGKRDKR